MGLTWNLAVFGVLALWASGTSATSAALSLKGEGRRSAPWSFGLCAVLVVAAALVALLGMQHPERMVNLLANPAAAITQQVYALIALFVLAVAWFVLRARSEGDGAPVWLNVLLLIAGVAVAVTVGRRFLVPSMPLLNTWLWVACGAGFACVAGTATVGVAERLAKGSAPRGLAIAGTVGCGLNVAATCGYLASVAQLCAAGTAAGITFDPTHPAAAAAGGLLGGSQLTLAWALGLGVGTLVPLVLAVVALAVTRACPAPAAASEGGSAKKSRCLLVALCAATALACVLAGALVLRGVVFGLL